MNSRSRIASLVFAIATLIGCSQNAADQDGGTIGILRFGTETVGDICVVVHKQEASGFQQIGYGTTLASGTFSLVTIGGAEPLVLEPGEYAFTLESLGPQIPFPAEFLSPEKSPLKTTWGDESSLIDLEAPEKLISGL